MFQLQLCYFFLLTLELNRKNSVNQSLLFVWLYFFCTQSEEDSCILGTEQSYITKFRRPSWAVDMSSDMVYCDHCRDDCRLVTDPDNGSMWVRPSFLLLHCYSNCTQMPRPSCITFVIWPYNLPLSVQNVIKACSALLRENFDQW